MWGRIKAFLNSLQHECDADTAAESILYFLQDIGLSEENLYDIEKGLCVYLDDAPPVRDFLLKAGWLIYSHLQTYESMILEESGKYFSDDEFVEDMYDGFEIKDITEEK